MENGRLDVGRDGRTCLARPNYQARTEYRNIRSSKQLTAVPSNVRHCIVLVKRPSTSSHLLILTVALCLRENSRANYTEGGVLRIFSSHARAKYSSPQSLAQPYQ